MTVHKTSMTALCVVLDGLNSLTGETARKYTQAKLARIKEIAVMITSNKLCKSVAFSAIDWLVLQTQLPWLWLGCLHRQPSSEQLPHCSLDPLK